MPSLPDFSIFRDEVQITQKVKHRAHAILIKNPLEGPISVEFHQELVDYVGDTPGRKTDAGKLTYVFDDAVAASSFTINNKTITGAEIAEWLIRDYVARRTAQLEE